MEIASILNERAARLEELGAALQIFVEDIESERKALLGLVTTMQMKSASDLPDKPTSETQKQFDDLPSATTNEGTPMYKHEDVSKEDQLQTKSRNIMFAIAQTLFLDANNKPLKGDAMTVRLREACSKILKCEVKHIHLLAQRDGIDVIRALEKEAVRRGVWTPRE